MKLLRSTKQDVDKDKGEEDVPKLESIKVALIDHLKQKIA